MYPDENFITLQGFEDAIMGVQDRTMRLVYSKSKIMRQLIREMDYETAMLHFDNNIEGKIDTPRMPIIVNDMFYTSGI